MNTDYLIKFKDLKISKKELNDKLGGDLFAVCVSNPVVIYNSDVINLLKAYKDGLITIQHLIDWTNTVWFTDLFC